MTRILLSRREHDLIEMAYLLMPGQATDVAAAFNRRRTMKQRMTASFVRAQWAQAKREGRLPKGRRDVARALVGPVLMACAREFAASEPNAGVGRSGR